MSYLFLLKCPNCKNQMKYRTNTKILTDKRKRCVYCGRSYKVRENLIKEV